MDERSGSSRRDSCSRPGHRSFLRSVSNQDLIGQCARNRASKHDNVVPAVILNMNSGEHRVLYTGDGTSGVEIAGMEHRRLFSDTPTPSMRRHDDRSGTAVMKGGARRSAIDARTDLQIFGGDHVAMLLAQIR